MGGVVPPLMLPVVELLGMWHAEPEGRRRSLRAAARTRTYHHMLQITLVRSAHRGAGGSTLSRVYLCRSRVCVLVSLCDVCASRLKGGSRCS